MNGFKKYSTSGLLVFVLCMCLFGGSVYATEIVPEDNEVVEETMVSPDVPDTEIASPDIPNDEVENIETGVESDMPTDTDGYGDSSELSSGEVDSEIIAILDEINLKLTPADETYVEVLKEESKAFLPMEIITQGEASTTDLYNVLVNIYNLGLLAMIVYLIVWSSDKIVSAFRRFIY